MPSVLRHATAIIALILSSLVFSSCSMSAPALAASSAGTSSAGGHVLTASPASINFGSQALNTTSTQRVAIINSGTGAVQVQSVGITGSTAFQVQGFTGTITLQPSQTLNLGINFIPTATTSYAGMLAVSANRGASMSVTVSGSGDSVGVTINPTAATVPTGLTQQFTATVTGSSNTGVTWSATRGTISSSGLYTSPSAAGTYAVTATSAADPTKSASATVTVSPPIAVSVTPSSVPLTTGAQQQFTANVSGSSNTAVTWSATGGTVSSAGLYTAPSATGSYMVTATSVADTTKSASATVAVTAPVVAVSVTPSSASLTTGATQQFTATVSGSSNTAVTWLATGGTVTSTGLYTAPGVAGTYTVTATSAADSTKSASAVVTVTAPSVVVTISPASAVVPTNATQQFTASVTGTTNGSVTWLVNGSLGGSATFGTISNAGLYTAPASAPAGGAVSVTAQSVADATKSASASVALATVYSNLDDSTALDQGTGTGWGWCGAPTCAGGASTATQQISWGQQPSLDGGSTQFLVSGSAWADGLWWYKVGPNNNASSFQTDFWLNVSQEASSYSQALEFDTFQFVIPTEYMFGTQCNYSQGYNNGTWDVWNQSTHHWTHTGFACPAFVPGDWYHITWSFNRTSDQFEHYNSVTVKHYDSTGATQIDSSTTLVNMALPSGPLPSGWSDNLGLNFQLDINGVPGSTGTATYTTHVDKVTLTVW